MAELTKPQAEKRIRGAQAKAMGDALEMATFAELVHQGAEVEHLKTITKVIRGRPVRVKTRGDFLGIDAAGRGLLVECKHRTDDHGHPRRPRPSDFEDHQIDAVRTWHRRGCLALAAYFDQARRVVFVPAVEIVGLG